jgi:hypothetical protein
MAKASNQQRAKVVDNPSLERDLSSQAVINRDASAYQHRMAHKQAHKAQKDDIQSLRDEVTRLAKLVLDLTASK